MKLFSYGLAVGLGYLLGRPDGRERLAQVGRQAADLAQKPEVVRLRERGKDVVTERAQAVKQKVVARNTHFPPPTDSAPPTALGGTTVMEDSEAAMLGVPATPRPESATPPADRS